MKEEITDALLRRFLLGKADDEERQRVESLFLTDSAMRERVLAVEQDLVEEYLEDSLSPGDREQFLLRYAQTSEQRRKLRITKSIKDWAAGEEVKEANVDHRNQPPASLWTRLFESLRARPVSVLPIAAVVVLALVLAFVWLNRRLEQREHLAIEQELAQLNDPVSLRDIPSRPDSPTLGPGTLRGAESASDLKLRSDVPAVELRLRWLRREYPTYRAVLRQFSDDKTFTIPNLLREGDGTIRLRLPSRILTRGLYQLDVTGIPADGSAGETEEYRFTAVD